jgi:uncharacterized protein DUF4402
LYCFFAIVCSNNIFAQAEASASANTTAVIVTPISIVKTTDMNFGNVAVSATVAGTVVLTPASVRTTTGGVTLPATTGTVAAAGFTVSGTAGYTYAITLPTTLSLDDNAAHTMTVNTFTNDPTSTGLLDGSGDQTLNVGATLNVSGGQEAGTYESDTDFEVTVVYN